MLQAIIGLSDILLPNSNAILADGVFDKFYKYAQK